MTIEEQRKKLEKLAKKVERQTLREKIDRWDKLVSAVEELSKKTQTVDDTMKKVKAHALNITKTVDEEKIIKSAEPDEEQEEIDRKLYRQVIQLLNEFVERADKISKETSELERFSKRKLVDHKALEY